jgi:outer membrane protein TolC
MLTGPVQAQVPAPANAPLTLTLKDALARAQMNAPQLLSAINDANVAREDLLQARAAQRPTASFKADYLGTQGNGVLSSGRFVTNDGVHVYRDWGVVHQDFTAALTRTGPLRAAAAETLAQARADIARRGLAVTVTRAYYALLTGQRKYATAQQSLDQAKRYLDITQSLERGGEVPRSDVVRADFQYSQQEQAFQEAKLAMDTARLDLAVLLFRDFDQNYTVVDDLDMAPALPMFAEIQTMAERENPDLRAANAGLTLPRWTFPSRARRFCHRSRPTWRTASKPMPSPCTAPWRPRLKKALCRIWDTL